MNLKNNNITTHNHKLSLDDRSKLNKHNSFLILFTGFSGSGKSTIASALELALYNLKIRTYILDGDNVRKRINKDLGFSSDDRKENMRRIGEISNLMIDAGIVTIAAFIAPFENERNLIKETVKAQNYIEIHLSTSIDECKRRDVKGLYDKVEKGEIKNMTGISSPYEVPENPDLKFDTEKTSVEDIVNKIMTHIKPKLQHE